jgi:hypothetical protein
LTLIDAVTQPAADGGAGSGAAAGFGETPAAALSRALQSALGSSYLKKLQEMADNDSSGGSGAAAGGGSKAEGLLAVFGPGLSSPAQLQAFLGSAAELASGAGQQEQDAALQKLLAAAVPAALWQRCAGSSLRVCWVAADAAAQQVQGPQQHVLPALQAVMRRHCERAAAAPLAELAEQCDMPQFAARLALPAPPQQAQQQVQQGGPLEEDEEDDGCWPQPASAHDNALDSLKVLVAKLDGHKGG